MPHRVPQVDADAIAVDDIGDGLGEPVGHLLAGPGGGQGASQTEQGARLPVAALGLEQARGAVQSAGRIACIDLEQLAFLRKERGAVFVHCQQAAVFMAVGAHGDSQPRRGRLRAVVIEQPFGVGLSLVDGQTPVMKVNLLAAGHADGQQVTGRPDLNRCAVCDPGQNVFDPARADEIGGGLEHAVQALLHRLQLPLEYLDLL
jgi:hypothetical protein